MSIKLKRSYILLLPSLALFFAYIIEYTMELTLCTLCMYQRILYCIMIIVALLSILGKVELTKFYIIVTILSLFLALYHIGVEKNIYQPSRLCKRPVYIKDTDPLSNFTKILYNSKTVESCNSNRLQVFKLSIAEWSLVLNLIVLGICIKYRNY